MFTAVGHLAVGGYMTAAVSNGQLRTWGFAAQYSLGSGNQTNRAYTSAATPDVGFATIIGLSTSSADYFGNGSTTLVLRQDGRVMCFGANNNFECGSVSDVVVPAFVQP
jgi:hypothetical protein